MNPAVSVIVAVFNAESTLSRCLDSIRFQTLKDIEVILVDDGSTDRSPSICDGYARSDPRIKVFHKHNEGVSATRQYGLEHASGDYVIFLDSDDYAAPEAYKLLYDCAIRDDAAVVCCNYFRITDIGTIAVNNVKTHYTIQSKLKELFQQGFLWNHLISRDLILRHSTRFLPGMQFGEDGFFMISLIASCKYERDLIRISSCRANLIFYDKTANPLSLSRLDSEKRFWAGFHWWETARSHLKLNKRDSHLLYTRLIDDSFHALWNNCIAPSDLYQALKPYYIDIRRHAPLSPQKILILMTCKGKYAKARRFKYLGTFRILRDKWQQAIARFH